MYAQVGLCFMFTIPGIFICITDLKFYLFCPHFPNYMAVAGGRLRARMYTRTQQTESSSRCNKERGSFPIFKPKTYCVYLFESIFFLCVCMHMNSVNCNFYLCSVKKFNAFFFSCALICTHTHTKQWHRKFRRQEGNALELRLVFR